MFIGKKKFRKAMLVNGSIASAGVVMGTAGLTTAICTSVSTNKKISGLKEEMRKCEEHIARLEGETTKLKGVIRPIQDTMFANGFLKN